MVNNKATIDNLRKKQSNILKSRKGDGKYMSLLGSKQKSVDLANIWEKYCSDFAFISSVEILNFVEKNEYTPSELQAFKAGLAAIPAFLIGNHKEVNPPPKKSL